MIELSQKYKQINEIVDPVVSQAYYSIQICCDLYEQDLKFLCAL